MRLFKNKNKGFTLVEFMLASAVFSFFIVLVMVGFLQINRTYNRGVTVKEVQQTARVILEDISRSISSSNEGVALLDPSVSGLQGFRLCLGSVKYAWNGAFNNAYTADSYSDSGEEFILIKSTHGDTCEEQPSVADSKVLIEGSFNTAEDGDLVIQSLEINPVASLNDVYTIDLVLSTDDEALTTTGVDAECEFNSGDQVREAARQYCSVIKVTTAVSVRKS